MTAWKQFFVMGLNTTPDNGMPRWTRPIETQTSDTDACSWWCRQADRQSIGTQCRIGGVAGSSERIAVVGMSFFDDAEDDFFALFVGLRD